MPDLDRRAVTAAIEAFNARTWQATDEDLARALLAYEAARPRDEPPHWTVLREHEAAKVLGDPRIGVGFDFATPTE